MKPSAHELRSTVQTKRSFKELLELWRKHDPETWQMDVEIYRLLATHFISQGELLWGLDVVCAGLQYAPRHVRLRQLQALALAGTGATAAAAKILSDLEAEDVEETLGLLGRIHKDLWRYTGDTAHLRSASDIYYKAFNHARDSRPVNHDAALYTGINAATTLFLLNDVDAARTLARDVRSHCLARLQQGQDYWADATLGEAALLLNEFDEAANYYRRAAAAAKGNWRELASMRRQAREILEKS